MFRIYEWNFSATAEMVVGALLAIVIATMASMQEGVNLQEAKSVVFAEHHYLPSTIEQSMARVRRFGQTDPVNVYHVLAKGTVDASVWRVMLGRHSNVQKALLEDLIITELSGYRIVKDVG